MSQANAESTSLDLYENLETPIENVFGMADITVSIFQETFGLETGPVTIDALSAERLSFAVHHLKGLIDKLHGQYHTE